ncbi:hypothetical protein VPJ68_01210, partial [Parabacteroides distasonis]
YQTVTREYGFFECRAAPFRIFPGFSGNRKNAPDFPEKRIKGVPPWEYHPPAGETAARERLREWSG